MAHLQAQPSANKGLSDLDEGQIIQQCIGFQPLVDKIPHDILTKITEYFILNHGMDLNYSKGLEVNNKRISLLTKGELSPTKPYFLFHTLSIKKDRAFVRYYFIYTNNGAETTIPITIDFVRNNSEWQILNHTI